MILVRSQQLQWLLHCIPLVSECKSDQYETHLIPGVLENLYFGVNESDCPLPCEIFSTETKLTTSIKSQDSTGFTIYLQQHVEVTDIMKIIFMIFFSQNI